MKILLSLFAALALALNVYCETANYGFWAAVPSAQRIMGAASQRLSGGGWLFSIPALQKGTSLLLESDVPFDISTPVESFAFNIEFKGNSQTAPIFAAAYFTGLQGGSFKAKLKAEGPVFKPVFEKGQEPGSAEIPLRLTTLELWVPASNAACEFTLKNLTVTAAGVKLRFDPSQFVEWDFCGRTVYKREEILKPQIKLRSLWPEKLQVAASLTEDNQPLWNSSLFLEGEQWKSLDISASPAKNGICKLLLKVKAPGQQELPLALHFGVDSYGENIKPNDAFGMNTHFARPGVKEEKYPDFIRIIRELGAGWIRLGLLEDPRHFNIDSKGWRLDAAWFEKYFRVAEAAGVKVSVLSNMLGWDEVVPRNGVNPREPFGDLAEWFRLHYAFARQFKGRVAAYELMNERDNNWKPELYFAGPAEKAAAKSTPYGFYSIGEHVAVSLAMLEAFKAADPATPVLYQGIGFLNDVTGTHVQLQYDRRMMELGVGNFTDIGNLHLYGWLHSGIKERDLFETIDGRRKNISRVDPLLTRVIPQLGGMLSNTIRQMMYYEAMTREFKRSGPVWVSECSQPASRPELYASEMKKARWTYDVSGERQAADVVISHAFIFASGAEKIYWFEDTDYVLIDPGFSLYDVRLCPKPAAISYRLMTQLLQDAKYEGELPVPQTMWAADGEAWEKRPTCFAPVFKLADGRSLAIVWSVAEKPETVKLDLSEGATELDIFGNSLPALKASGACELKFDSAPRLLFGSFKNLINTSQPLAPQPPSAAEKSWDKSLFMVTPLEVVLARPGEEKEMRVDIWSASGKAQTVSLKLSLPQGSGWEIVRQPSPVKLPEGQFVRGTTYARLKAKSTTDEITSPANLFKRPRLKIEADSSTGKTLVPILQDLAVSDK